MKIAISGLSGVGSSTTGKLVAQRLNLPMNNFTFRDLAKERGVAFEVLQEQSKNDEAIDLELDKRLIEFINSHENCLSVTDLSCWLDDERVYKKLGLASGPSFDMKIWLEAPIEERAVRMHEREGGDFQKVLAYNNQRDLDNRERYLKLYGLDIFDHSNIDWVFDTSKLTLEEVVNEVCNRVVDLSQQSTS